MTMRNAKIEVSVKPVVLEWLEERNIEFDTIKHTDMSRWFYPNAKVYWVELRFERDEDAVLFKLSWDMSQ